MPRAKPTPKELAERAVRNLVGQLMAARLRVAELEAEIAQVSGLLGGAGVAPVAAPSGPREKLTLPAELAAAAFGGAPAEEPVWEEPPIDLAGEDNMGPGRFI